MKRNADIHAPKIIINLIDVLLVSKAPSISSTAILSETILDIAIGIPDANATKNIYKGYDI